MTNEYSKKAAMNSNPFQTSSLSNSTPYTFLSDMKNRERVADNDVFFDSPSNVVSELDSSGTANKHDGGDEDRDSFSIIRSRLIELGKRSGIQLSSSSDNVIRENYNEYNVGKKYDGGGDEMRDGFSILSKRLKILSIEMGERRKKQLLCPPDSVVKENFNEQKLVNNEEKLSFFIPSEIAKKLYPHQREGVKWLWSLHLQGKGGILGDDMGLGKTIQICGFLAGLFHSNLTKKVLIVAPKTLLPHWIKELSALGLSEKTREYAGTCANAREFAFQCILQDKGVLLTTYDIVRCNGKSLSKLTWDYTILDEGHLIKNPATQRAKHLRLIPSAHRIILTGTPLQNNLKELWALFNFCFPALLCRKKCFKYEYENPILRGNEKDASDREKHIGSAVAQDLRQRIQPYFLRRLKNEVFRNDDGTNTPKLSKKNELIVWLQLSSCQRMLYEAFLSGKRKLYEAFWNKKIDLPPFESPLAALTILKKICDHPLLLTKRAAKDVLKEMETVLNPEDYGSAKKLAKHIAEVANNYDIEENSDILSCKISFIVSLLDNLIPEGHNVLIFSQTRKMLNLIQDSLNARGYKFLRIDGTTKDSDRVKIVNDFQEGVVAPIFLLTSKVGGLGLTLTKADRVIVVDPAWNPSTDSQSVDRAYRIGQKKDVIVYRLITCGTIEEKIYRKQIYKGGLFKSATEHKEQIRYFSQQDLKDLFRIPTQGFDVSLTQQQLHREHDREHKMDSSLKIHTTFLESLGIAGISNHSLVFSKTGVVPVVPDKDLIRWIKKPPYLGNSSLRSSNEHNIDAIVKSPYAGYSSSCSSDVHKMDFPKGPVLQRRYLSPSISNKLTKSEIKQQTNHQSQDYIKKAVATRLSGNGKKIKKQIGKLDLEPQKLSRTNTVGSQKVVVASTKALRRFLRV